jgi:hypothetical protein
VVVALVGVEMVPEIVDPVGQDRDLYGALPRSFSCCPNFRMISSFASLVIVICSSAPPQESILQGKLPCDRAVSALR